MPVLPHQYHDLTLPSATRAGANHLSPLEIFSSSRHFQVIDMSWRNVLFIVLNCYGSPLRYTHRELASQHVIRYRLFVSTLSPLPLRRYNTSMLPKRPAAERLGALKMFLLL